MGRCALATLALIAVCLGAQPAVRALADTPPGWPQDVKGDTGFANLGKAIQKEPGFPANGSDVEKARYVFSRMSDVTTTYSLKPGSGRKLSDSVIGLYRTFGNDAENADSLKGFFGWGNCGEWSYAFSETLGGAGVVCRVIYGDKDGNPGFSGGFTGTDTTVVVEERGPGGQVSRRVFDAFRAAYHSPTAVPTDETLKDWGDVPLTDDDRWQDEDKARHSWQKTVDKNFAKDASSQKVLDGVPQKFRPGNTKRPGSADFTGTWRDSGGGKIVLKQVGDKVTGDYTGGKGHEGLTGTLKGTVEKGVLSATFKNMEGEVRGEGTFELTVKEGRVVGTWKATNGLGGPVNWTK